MDPRRVAEAEGKMHRTVRLAVVGLLAFAAPVSAQDAGAQQSTQVPSIVTSGEATVHRAPDIAFVSIAVETRARTPREAQQLNADAMSSVQQRVAKAGVARDAVRTTGYSIQQEFDFANGRQLLEDQTPFEVRLIHPPPRSRLNPSGLTRSRSRSP